MQNYETINYCENRPSNNDDEYEYFTQQMQNKNLGLNGNLSEKPRVSKNYKKSTNSMVFFFYDQEFRLEWTKFTLNYSIFKSAVKFLLGKIRENFQIGGRNETNGCELGLFLTSGGRKKSTLEIFENEDWRYIHILVLEKKNVNGAGLSKFPKFEPPYSVNLLELFYNLQLKLFTFLFLNR